MTERISLRLAKGSLYTYASLIFLKVLATANSVIIARWLGPDNLGVYSVFSQIYNLVLAFGLMGMPVAVGKFVAEYQKKSKSALEELLSTVLIFSFIAAFVISSVLFFSSDALAEYLYAEPRLIYLLKVGAAVVFVSVFVNIAKSVLQGFNKIESLAKINMLTGIAALILTVIFVVKFRLKGVVFRDLSVAAVSLFLFVAIIFGTFRSLGLIFKPILKGKLLIKIFKLSMPLFIGSAAIFGSNLFIRSYLALKCGFDKTGLFHIANNFFQLIYFVPQAIALPFLPLITTIYHSDRSNFSKSASRVVKLSGAIVLPVAVFVGLFAGPAVNLLYGKSYAESHLVVFMMVFSGAVLAPAYILGQVMVASGFGFQILVLSLLQAGVNVASSYFFINFYGFNGIGIAFIVSSAFNYLVSGFYLIRRLELKSFEMRFAGYQLSLLIFGSMTYLIISRTGGITYALFSLLLLTAVVSSEYRSLDDYEKKLLMSAFRSVFVK